MTARSEVGQYGFSGLPGIPYQEDNSAAVDFDLQSLLDQGMRPGLGLRNLNALVRASGILLETPSLGALRTFCQTEADWQQRLMAVRKGIGSPGIEELDQVLAYFSWVDSYSPDGVPPGAIELLTHGERLFCNFPTSTRSFLPIFDFSLATALAKVIRQGETTLIAPGGRYEEWQQEIQFLAKYYGLVVKIKKEEELREENLERLVEAGRTVFNQLSPASLNNSKVGKFLNDLHYFHFFDSASVMSLERFFCLVLGIIEEFKGLKSQGRMEGKVERNVEIFYQYFFEPETTYKALAGEYGGLTKDRVRQVINHLARRVRGILKGKSPSPSLLLPERWFERETVFPKEEEKMATPRGERSFLEVVRRLGYYKANLHIKKENGENHLALDFSS